MSSGTGYRPRKKRPKMTLYDESWQQLPEFRDWLDKSENQDNARCKYCNKDIPLYLVGVDALIKHEQTRSHRSNIPVFYGPKPLEDYVEKAKESLDDLCKKHNMHGRTANHLVQLLADVLPDSHTAQKLAADTKLVNLGDSDDSD